MRAVWGENKFKSPFYIAVWQDPTQIGFNDKTKLCWVLVVLIVQLLTL